MKIFQKKLAPAFASLILGITLWCGGGLHPQLVKAQTRNEAPDELLDLIEDIDRAANRQRIDKVMDFYSEDFINSDGLDRDSLERAIAEFWELYPILRYRTEIESWELDGDAIIAETVTYITGLRRIEDRNMNLTATIRSKQRYENEQIVEQEILAERNQQTLGEEPPEIKISLPQEVFVREQYNFDTILVEPLGDEMAIGVAVEEAVSDDAYFEAASFELEELRSGGIFKIGIAPPQAESRWLSTIFMREGGVTINTHRLRVLEPGGVR
ncbi:MAG: nuclear transport factor 2 family protein [Okeania sp. SIO2H7]|nr:nuclear transport factor 2 family protein [Okeania sp. SIO2H7]